MSESEAYIRLKDSPNCIIMVAHCNTCGDKGRRVEVDPGSHKESSQKIENWAEYCNRER